MIYVTRSGLVKLLVYLPNGRARIVRLHAGNDFSTGGIRPQVARLLEYGQPLDRVELLTVCEMAEILGVTQESVSRILATFKRGEILQKLSDPSREIYRIDAAGYSGKRGNNPRQEMPRQAGSSRRESCCAM